MNHQDLDWDATTAIDGTRSLPPEAAKPSFLCTVGQDIPTGILRAIERSLECCLGKDG